MITTEFNVTATTAALRKLALSFGPEARRVMNSKLGEDLQRWVFRNFKAEGKLARPAGWAQLKPSTIQSRARKVSGKGKRAYVRGAYRRGLDRQSVVTSTKHLYGSAGGMFRILQDTGALRQSFHKFYTANEAGVGAESYPMTRKSARHGKSKSSFPPPDLAKIHQEGRPSHNLPARPMLPSRKQATDMAMSIYGREYKRAVNRFK